jgi:hypothetical protein
MLRFNDNAQKRDSTVRTVRIVRTFNASKEIWAYLHNQADGRQTMQC